MAEQQLATVEAGKAGVPSINPTHILAKAYEQNASIEQLTQLLDLQDRFYAQQEKLEAREAEKAFNLAMAKFKANAPKIIKDRKVSYNSTAFDHASLANVVYTISETLSQYGLSATWNTNQESGLITVTCSLAHELGHSKSVSLSGAPDMSGGKNNIQGIASTVTYLERYTLLAITGLATHEQDNDGKGGASNQQQSGPVNLNQHQQAQPQTQQQQQRPQPTLKETLQSLTGAYQKLGVTQQQITDHIGGSLDDITAEQLDDLRRRYAKLRDGETTAQTCFQQQASAEQTEQNPFNKGE